MSSITIESISATTSSSSGTLTVAKPSGLAEGDLMVFTGVSLIGSATSVGISTKSGWSLGASNGSSGEHANIQYKIADSGDVSASDFAFSFTSGSGQSAFGKIFRLSSIFTSSVVEDTDVESTDSASVDTTFTFSPTLDFTVPNCFIFAVLAVGDPQSGSPAAISDYTSTPTLSWTEAFDVHADGLDGGANIGGSVVYAEHTGTTSLSAFSATLDSSMDDHYLAMVAVRPEYPTSGTTTLLDVSPTQISPSGRADTNANATLIESDPSFATQSGSATTPTTWTNETPETTTWTNETES